jgi:hypothetical protein
VCVNEGIRAARELLKREGFYPMTILLNNKEQIKSMFYEWMNMKPKGLPAQRIKYCIGWVYSHYLANENPKGTGERGKSFAQNFIIVQGDDVGSSAVTQFLSKYIIDDSNFKKIPPIVHPMVEYLTHILRKYKDNPTVDIFWNLEGNEDALRLADVEKNLEFAIYNEKENAMIDVVNHLVEQKSQVVNNILALTLGTAVMMGDTGLTNELLRGLTPEQKFFFGVKIDKEDAEAWMKDLLTHSNDAFSDHVELAFAGRNYALLNAYYKNLSNEKKRGFLIHLCKGGILKNEVFKDVWEKLKWQKD